MEGRARLIHYRQPPGANNTLWYGLYRPQQSGAGIELGSVFLLCQFSLERGDLLLGLCERGRRAAHLRDEFVKGGAALDCTAYAGGSEFTACRLESVN